MSEQEPKQEQRQVPWRKSTCSQAHFSDISYKVQAHLLGTGMANSGLGPLALFSNQEKALQACPQTSLMEVISQLRLALPRYVEISHYIHANVHSLLKTKP